MFKGLFDTDQAALQVRADINGRVGTSLEKVLCEQLQLNGKELVLELGCGSGKQTRYLRERYPELQIMSTDACITDSSKIPAFTIQAYMDDLNFGAMFDAVISVYSFYYSTDMIHLGRRIAKWLKPGGSLLLMGPAAGTNQEIIDIVNRVSGCHMVPGTQLASAADFLSATDINKIKRPYRAVSEVRFTNTVEFISHAEFFSWWENHDCYVPSVRDAVAEVLPAKMKVTKNVMCLVFTK